MTDALTEFAGPRQGLMFILSSPSGAGKSSISRKLLSTDDALTFSVSATTRPKRLLEIDGKDYHFVSRERFQRMIDEGEMLEYAEVFGNYYGTPLAPVEAAISEGRDMLFDIDWQGGAQIRNSTLQHAVVSVFLLPPSMAELEGRLRGRAQDSNEVVDRRMREALDEISHWQSYDYVLVNRDLEACVEEVRAILDVERLKRKRRPGLVNMVRSLNKETQGQNA